jgi:hypothetical protein
MGFELCYLPDTPAVLRALLPAQRNSIEKWGRQLEGAVPFCCKRRITS